MTQSESLATTTVATSRTDRRPAPLLRTAGTWIVVLLVPLVGMILCSVIAARKPSEDAPHGAANAGMLTAAVLMSVEIVVLVRILLGLLLR